jgi:CheY-like chemotaxis protein
MVTKEVERYLRVGVVVMLYTGLTRKDAPNARTILRGWHAGSHLFIDRPKTGRDALLALQEKQTVILRYIVEGQACAFSTQVIDWDTRKGYPYLRLLWPTEIQLAAFRQHERIRLNIPCRAVADNIEVFDAEIQDLSEGGCGLWVESANIPEAIKTGTHLHLTFSLPDGVKIEELRVCARSLRPQQGGILLGCQYESGQSDELNDIRFFVTSLREHQRLDAGDVTRRRALLIDPDTAMSQKIRREFERRDVDTITVSAMVDGIHFLRVSPPAMVVARCGLPELSGANLCRLLRNTRGLESVPIFMYGEADAGQMDDMIAAGVTAFFAPSPVMPLEVAVTAIKHLDLEA